MEGSGDNSSPGFTPLVVLELASDTKEEAIQWLLNRIEDSQQNGGGFLYALSFPFHCIGTTSQAV